MNQQKSISQAIQHQNECERRFEMVADLNRFLHVLKAKYKMDDIQLADVLVKQASAFSRSPERSRRARKTV